MSRRASEVRMGLLGGILCESASMAE